MPKKVSDTFCIIPWIHLHSTPAGTAAPCCIAKACSTEHGFGSTRSGGLMDLVNNDKMKKLRLDMLNGIKNEECYNCHIHEEQGLPSFRTTSNNEYGRFIDESLLYTNLDDGSLTDFKMRYYDIRFSNICNFKCRTCGQEFSSQWEQENLRNNVSWAKEFPKNTNTEFLQDVIDQIPNLEIAYFAGGEPLITDEHYILLEEMIKQNRTDVRLRYNTNFSNLKFKNKDLLGLWKHFKRRIDIYASIDHYGERAEYIRHGTDWAVVESNYLMAKQLPYIDIKMNTVLSVFNYLTIDKFYEYVVDKQMIKPTDNISTLYNMVAPTHFTVQTLPLNLKEKGKSAIDRAMTLMKNNYFKIDQINQLSNTSQWAFSNDTYSEQNEKFKEEVRRVDKIRNEDFVKVFPELKELMD